MPGNPRFDWCLDAWMRQFGFDQVALRQLTGWSQRKASELCSGQQRFNRDSLNEAARAFDVMPFELLMLPEDAYEIRALRAASDQRRRLRAVAEEQRRFTAAPEPSNRLPARRKAN